MKPVKTKPDKIPYRINGKRADATNSQHYSSFDETVDAFAKGGYAGIGIGCFEPLRLVDVDDCVVKGKLDARGQDIVDTLDSYTELSPSGNGNHIFILEMNLLMTVNATTSTIATPMLKSMLPMLQERS